jgi:hypothetical protein
MPDYHVSMGEWLAQILRILPNTVVIPTEWVRREAEENHEALLRVVARLRELQK